MITLDITGFYFSKTIPLDGAKTVEEVMDAVVEATKNQYPRFTYEPSTKKPKFLRSITVEFDESNPPKSRQNGKEKTPLLFTYDDESGFEMEVPNAAPFSLVWQYYVNDEENFGLKNRVGAGDQRRIIGFGNSDTESGGITLEPGDTITWRLVGIFGKHKVTRTPSVKSDIASAKYTV